MCLLKTDHLTKIYRSEASVEAVTKVNFEMEKGDLVAIVGDSGSGKSTFLHLIAGVEKPTEGDIFIQGQNLVKLSDDQLAIFRRRHIGVVYQFFNLLPNLTVEKNILLPLLLDKKREDKSYFEDIIHTLGIGDKLARYPKQLSGGEQQRVAIARSLIARPSIILADEPTGNLDRKNSEEITALFKRINQKFQTTILIVTHDDKVALACDKVYKMIDGQLVFLEAVHNEIH